MGLFNKLKNVLFEEEIVDVPNEDPVIIKEKPKEEKVVEKKRNVFEENVFEENVFDEPILKEREPFKVEKKFDFPDFDDQEFDDMKSIKPKVEKKEKEEPKKSMSINLFDYEKPKIPKEKPTKKAQEIKGRAYEAKVSEVDSKKFRPSPVISPVYGVLDKNYTKEEITIKKEAKKALDVDEARKKAFGPLEEEYKSTRKEKKPERSSKRKYPTREEKSIDDLLEETAFDEIIVPDYEEEKEESYNLERLDKKRAPKTEEEIIESDDTLESDLFDLIDSMYENREDDEE